MDVLLYNELNISDIKKQYDAIVASIRKNDFSSSGVKRVSDTSFYLAPLNQTQYLLFKVVADTNKNYALILEIIDGQHKSRFLHGLTNNKIELISTHHFEQVSENSLMYLNRANPHFHIL